MAALVLADHDQDRLSPATARIVAAAQALGPVDILVAAANANPIAAEAAALSGVRRVLTAESDALAQPWSDALVPLLAGLALAYDQIVASASAVGREVIPRLAATLDLMPITDVIAIHDAQRFDRPIYAGNAIETVRSEQPKQLLTIRASAFRPVGQGVPAPVESSGASITTPHGRFVADHRTEGDTPDLSTAQIVVSGGVSFGSAEKFALVEQLAAALNAAVGATRAAVDAGYAPNDWQVGQTGKIIAPDLYIAVGISGALQHLAGIQGAKKIVAINTDADAPLMKLADVALVADLNTAVPALIAELQRLGVKP